MPDSRTDDRQISLTLYRVDACVLVYYLRGEAVDPAWRLRIIEVLKKALGND